VSETQTINESVSAVMDAPEQKPVKSVRGCVPPMFSAADVDLDYSVAVSKRMEWSRETFEQACAAIDAERAAGELPEVPKPAPAPTPQAPVETSDHAYRWYLEAQARKDIGIWRGLSMDELQDQVAIGDGPMFDTWCKRRGIVLNG